MSVPTVIVRRADAFELNRCKCPVCVGLDARYPSEGYQLALFAYRMQTPPNRWPT